MRRGGRSPLDSLSSRMASTDRTSGKATLSGECSSRETEADRLVHSHHSLPKASPKEQVTALRAYIYGEDFEPPSTFQTPAPATNGDSKA